MLPIVAFFQAVAWAEASKTCGSTFIQKVTTKAIPAALAEAEEHQGRRLHIINQCQRPMVMHTTGGNTEIPCASGCPKGLTCNPNTEQCYFDMPKLSTGWTIPAGAVVQLFTPNDPVKQGNGVTADWSGKLEFYPNVSDGGLPSSAICNGFERCPTYQGLNGVATAVEFTFVPHGADFYDISIINGFNIGIEMKPDGSFRQVYEGNAASQRGYNCGAAGATAQPDQRLSPCSWEFVKKLRQAEVDDITPLLTQVDGGYGSCTRHADCTGFGIVCGQVGKTIWDPVSQVYRPTTEITMECGHYIGSWTAYQLCVWSGNSYRSPPPYEGLIDCPSMHDMFACAGPLPWTTSCYSHKVPESGECCGCANWTENLGIPVPDGGAGCQGASPTWTEKAMPFYQILKAGCPTAYTYAFDDETSTFTCRTAESQGDGSVMNRAGYNITLCPEAPDFQRMGAFENQACRGASPGDSKEEYYILHNKVTWSRCKEICRHTTGCKGVEFGPYGRCEVWTRDAGIQSTATVNGYQCFRYVPFEFELIGEDQACRGKTSEDSSSRYYRLHEKVSSSQCKELCQQNSDVCKGIELGPFGRCEMWTHVGGIHATKPVTGHSCHRYVPSDFELMGTGDSACRGDFWYDNSIAYFEHRKEQTLASCKELCRAMANRCKGIEFGPYGRCELWTRQQGIQAIWPLKGYSCYRYVPL